MAEKLSEIGNVLGGLGDAIKTMKTIQKSSKELYRVTEQTKKYSEAVQKIEIPGDAKLKELKEVLTEVLYSSAKLESELEHFDPEIAEFDKYLRDNIKGSSIPHDVILQLCEKLTKMQRMSQSFSNAFNILVNNLERAQHVATELEAQERQKAESKSEEADRKRNQAVAGGVSAVVSIGICAALGFFTGGAGWIAGAAMVGAAGASGAVTIMSGLDMKKMREQAKSIVSGVEMLGVLAKNLKSDSDKIGLIKLDKEALEALKTALEFLKNDFKKDQLIEEQQIELQNKGERIAELERKLNSLGH